MSRGTPLRLRPWRAVGLERRESSSADSTARSRARSPAEAAATTTGAALLARYRECGPFFTDEKLARVEKLNRFDGPAEDTWARS